MGDTDQTIYSSRSTAGGPDAPRPPEESKRNPLLIIGGIGCVLLLCAGLLIAGGLFLAGDQLSDFVSGLSGDEEPSVVEVPTVAPTPIPSPTPEVTGDATATGETEGEVTETQESGSAEDTSPTGSDEPIMGEITFALGATEDHEPIDPADSFEEGITEVHAIFEYSGILPDYTWERVWYLDGSEVLRSSEVWGGDEAGIFDYFINAGGDPLTPGEWVLELYVEGELLATGSFVIEPTEVAATTPDLVQDATDTAEHDADIDSATPTSTPPATPTPKPAAPVAKTYKLVYTKWDGGRHNLYIGDTNGDTDQFILHNAAGPSWSADGQSIFFFGEPGVNRQDRSGFPGVSSCELPGISDGIVAIEAPSPPNDFCIALGSVFQGPGWNDGTARWTSVSPDGSMVAYDARPGGNYRIYFLGTADNQQFQFEIVGEQGDWSPDSQKVVYRSGREGKTGIWISNRDDSGHTLITSNGSDSFPAWSPDGTTIAFSRDEGGNVDIYTVNVDGSNLKRLTDAPGPDSLPVYTPSGQIIFRSARTGSWGIWKMNGDGSNQQEIIPDAGVGPDWAYSKMDVLP